MSPTFMSGTSSKFIMWVDLFTPTKHIPHIMKRHMQCDMMCQAITLPNHPFGKDDKFTTDTYSGLYAITYKTILRN